MKTYSHRSPPPDVPVKPVARRLSLLLAPILTLFAVMLPAHASANPIPVSVDFAPPIKTEVRAGSAGLNLCWLLDSDLRRAQLQVCVNAVSFKYEGGPSSDQLKASAVAWVAYARKNGYWVASWQIGNEVEHSGSGRLLRMKDSVALYGDFARANETDPPSSFLVRSGRGHLGA